MIRGFYSAASALVAGMFRQELISHNLANIDTAGFKELNTGLDEFERRVITRLPDETPIGALSLGVMSDGAFTNFASGALQQTGQPFDLAIAGDGFFRVLTPEGERYTRDGRFTRDADGHLATVDGYLLLGAGGQPLIVPQGEVSIAPDGNIRVGEQAAGQITLAAFPNPNVVLQRAGPNLFAAADGAVPATATEAAIQQGFLETSNVDAVRATTQMAAVARAYEAAQRTLQMQDEMLGKAVNEIGRV